MLSFAIIVILNSWYCLFQVISWYQTDKIKYLLIVHCYKLGFSISFSGCLFCFLCRFLGHWLLPNLLIDPFYYSTTHKLEAFIIIIYTQAYISRLTDKYQWWRHRMKKPLYMDKYHCEPYHIISVNSHFKGMMDALFIKSDILDRRN